MRLLTARVCFGLGDDVSDAAGRGLATSLSKPLGASLDNLVHFMALPISAAARVMARRVAA
jgi:hypothetical protein